MFSFIHIYFFLAGIKMSKNYRSLPQDRHGPQTWKVTLKLSNVLYIFCQQIKQTNLFWILQRFSNEDFLNLRPFLKYGYDMIRPNLIKIHISTADIDIMFCDVRITFIICMKA